MKRKQAKKFLLLMLACCAIQQSRGQLFIFREFEVNQIIPDGGELLLTHDYSVLGSGTISSLRVGLNIQGTTPGSGFNGDLYSTLGHGSGYAVLLNRPGKNNLGGAGYSDSGLDVIFDDSAANGDIHTYREVAGAGSLDGVWGPDGRTTDPNDVVTGDSRTALLSSFTGASTDGEWRLFTADLSTAGTHRLESWSFEMVTGADFTGAMHFEGHEVRAEGGARNVSAPLQITSGVTFGGTHALTFSGATVLNGTASIEVENTTRLGALSETGSAGLTKRGSGTLILTGAGSYTGLTTVEAGTLLVENTSGSATGTGNVEVRSGAMLGGTGSIAGAAAFESGSTVSPGNGTGTLALGNTLFGGGATYRFELNQAESGQGAAAGWDWLNVTGTLTIAATEANPIVIEFHSLGLDNNPGTVYDLTPDGRYTWTIATASGGVANFEPSFFRVDSANFLNDYPGAVFGLQLSGNELQLTLVPEPVHYGMIAGGMLMAFGWWRRRRMSRGAGVYNFERRGPA